MNNLRSMQIISGWDKVKGFFFAGLCSGHHGCIMYGDRYAPFSPSMIDSHNKLGLKKLCIIYNSQFSDHFSVGVASPVQGSIDPVVITMTVNLYTIIIFI